MVTTEYHISLKPDANPVCLFTPRKVLRPLLPKVKEELDWMAQYGIISPDRTNKLVFRYGARPQAKRIILSPCLCRPGTTNSGC